jgi:sugar lactone lactonase YvrE
MKNPVIISSHSLRCRQVLLCASFLALTGLMLPQAAQAQSNFGSVAVGSSATTAVTLTFPNAATLGSIAVVTQGAPNLDFTNGGGGTCAVGKTYSMNSTCTVSVAFAPIAPGLRRGAVVLSDNSGNVLATVPVFGDGTGPQITFQPGARINVGSGIEYPAGVAADAFGNLFVTGYFNGLVYEILADGDYTTVKNIDAGVNNPQGVAVDGSGNLFVIGDGRLNEILIVGGYSDVRLIAEETDNYMGVAIDGGGNVFFAGGSSPSGELTEYLASSGYERETEVGSGFSIPEGIAVDASGNIFVADNGSNAVYEIPASDYTTVKELASGFNGPVGVAVDASGNIYVADSGNNAVKEILAVNGSIPSSPTIKTLGSGFNDPWGVAVDGSGNVFVGDTETHSTVKLDFADPPSLNFPTPTRAGSTDTKDGPQTLSVANIGNQPLIFTTPGTGGNPTYPASFPANSGDSILCNTDNPVGPGASCDISMNFKPIGAGANSGNVVLTDNNLNQTNAVQTIALGGNATGAPTITWATPAAITYGTPLSAAQLDASASVAGTFAYSPSAGAVLPGGLDTLTVTFTPTDTTDYLSATANAQLTVNQASQTVSFPAPASQRKGTDANLSASSTSGLTVGFTSLTPAVCTVSGAWASFVATGSCTIQASQAGNIDYLAAAPVSQTFSVGSSTETTHQTVSFTPISSQIAATTANLAATASSGLPVSFQSATPSVCTVSGTTVSLIAYGFCTIQAWQGGNSQYYAAPLVSQQFGVAHARQSINFPKIANQAAATTLNLSATASSGLPVIFTSTTPSVCTVSGSNAALVSYGFCEITASQAGDNLSGGSEYFPVKATQKFGVAHASQSISFPSVPDQTVGTSLGLGATASSGLPVSYLSETPSICTVSGATASFVAPGICIIQAMQWGNSEYLGALPVRQKNGVDGAQ